MLVIAPAGGAAADLRRFQVFAPHGAAPAAAQQGAELLLQNAAQDNTAVQAIRSLYGNKWGSLDGLAPDQVVARLRLDLADGHSFAAFYIPAPDTVQYVVTTRAETSTLLQDPAGDPLKWSPAQRIGAMLRRIPAHLPGALAAQVTAAFTPKAVALLALMLAALAVAQAYGVGEIVDLILVGAAWAAAGWGGLVALKDFIGAVIDAAGQTSIATIEADAAQAADALVVLGITFVTAVLLRAQDQEKMVSLEKPPPEEPVVSTKQTSDRTGWGKVPSTAEPKIAETPAATKTAREVAAEETAAARPAILDSTMGKYARPAEQATAKRLADAYPEFNGRTFSAPPPPDPGFDWVDDLGQTYDAMGDGTKSKYFKLNQFTDSIDSHLLKGNKFTVIDVTGYTTDQIQGIKAYVDALPEAQQALIRRIGF